MTSHQTALEKSHQVIYLELFFFKCGFIIKLHLIKAYCSLLLFCFFFHVKQIEAKLIFIESSSQEERIGDANLEWQRGAPRGNRPQTEHTLTHTKENCHRSFSINTALLPLTESVQTSPAVHCHIQRRACCRVLYTHIVQLVIQTARVTHRVPVSVASPQRGCGCLAVGTTGPRSSGSGLEIQINSINYENEFIN